MLNFQNRNYYYLLVTACFSFLSCSIQHKITRSAKEDVLTNKALQAAHVGISIFDPADNKYLYNYQGDKYFVPASNTKIPTCYAAMKYLGKNLRGLDFIETDSVLFIRPTADPTFLHRDFRSQPAFEYLLLAKKRLAFVYPKWEAEVYGSGWAWNDYNASYMPERSELPIYGNVIEYSLDQKGGKYNLKGDIHFFRYALNLYVDPVTPKIRIRRRRLDNTFDVFSSTGTFTRTQIPFRTFENQRLLEDTLKKGWTMYILRPTVFSVPFTQDQPTPSSNP